MLHYDIWTTDTTRQDLQHFIKDSVTSRLIERFMINLPMLEACQKSCDNKVILQLNISVAVQAWCCACKNKNSHFQATFVRI